MPGRRGGKRVQEGERETRCELRVGAVGDRLAMTDVRLEAKGGKCLDPV